MVRRIRFSDRDVQGDVCSINHVCREKIDVGEVRAQVTIRNAVDLGRVRAGDLPSSEVRQCVREGVVDTGSVRMVIPQSVVEEAALPEAGTHVVVLAGGERRETRLVGPVSFEINGREAAGNAVVFGDEVLIGQIFLEETDQWVDCKNQRLVGNPNHPDGPATRI